MKVLIDKLLQYRDYLNERGISIPVLRDPVKKAPSVSLTLLFLSGNVVLAGLIGKIAGKLGGIDMTQALYWFGMCAALYFGRSFSGSGKDVKLDDKKDEEK